MALTGRRDGPPLLAPGPFAAAAADAIAALARLAGPEGSPARRTLEALDAAALLAEKAAASGLRRAGAIAPGGRCRLLRAADGWLAPNLAREEDVALLPAWLEDSYQSPPAADRRDDAETLWDGPTDAVWKAISQAVAGRDPAELTARGREIGLAVAAAMPPPREAPSPLRVVPYGTRAQRPADARPRVVDLTALWAGPLCGNLLGLAGAEVIKIESLQRPDGARAGPARFFDALNGGKRSVALDFRDREDLARLREVLASADIVLESSRPRALRQLGIEAEAWLRAAPGRSWISITAYGREGPGANWIGFGDDTAVAAGAARALERQCGEPVFCADAIADPLTGLQAAVAALSSFREGGAQRLDLALCDVTAALLCAPSEDGSRARVLDTGDGQWFAESRAPGRERVAVAEPRVRTAAPAAALGEHTRAVLAEAAERAGSTLRC
jgi:hypothetical protein